ncbi:MULTISPECIES: alpha/beta fold hydrolase [unclassified Streptomyces]|uniref:thioesterase II family protein n=1 Tax=unclassified Streptomyces TaxID=2593676 RepID=UPI0029B6549A|nr:alpha/beta fold hydrolase [Streptomyces sp. DK15]MDX2393821.1 alpha/beta fold hydrolase [Streptomyces sp. DK15]
MTASASAAASASASASAFAHRGATAPVRPDGDRWFRRYAVRADPSRRLLILPHAGGSASFFHSWGVAFDEDTEVLVARYPGRHDRLTDPCVHSMEELADRVTEALLPFLDVPVSLFGHSMGASVAYEVALRLESRYGVRPAALHVSSRKAPHRLTPRALYEEGDEALIAEVRRLGGTHDSLLDDPDLREILLPAIRADFKVVGTYGPRPATPVGCPVHAHIGDQDPSTTIEDMAAWSDVAPAGFDLQTLPGGHFYLLEHREALIGSVSRHLTATA